MSVEKSRPRFRWPLATTVVVATAALVLTGCSVLSTDGTATKGSTSAGTVTAQPIPTVVVLDASDSMNTADAPGPRIDAAKAAVTTLADSLPDGTGLGVVAFGSQTSARTTPHDRGCTDVRTVVPLNPVAREALTSALGAIRAQGFTPIGTALDEAARQLPSSGPASIVLVSDGESTCAPDPCETAKAIHSSRPDVTISTVGFRTDAASLQCVATGGGGLFVTAHNAAQLSARLTAAQNSRAAATRLSTTSRDGITIGTTLGDIRSTHPDFPTQGRKDGDRTVYLWRDCTFSFDESNALVEIAPGDPPGAAGTTIDGVTKGTAGARAVELYGEAVNDSNGTATFPADEKAGTGYRIGYEGGSSIKDGTVTTVVLCGCLPTKGTAGSTSGKTPGKVSSTASSRATGGPEKVTVIAADRNGKPINGYRRGSFVRSLGPVSSKYCSSGVGATTPGLYNCGGTADGTYNCWNNSTAQELLCLTEPDGPDLKVYGYTGSLTPITPAANPDPWSIELVNGRKCIARLGGAWPAPPAGFDWAYGCSTGGDYNFIMRKHGGSGKQPLFDTSGKDWTVYYGDGNSTPTPVAVKKIYYSAAEQ